MSDQQRQNEARRIRLEVRNRRKLEEEKQQLDPDSDRPTIDEFPSDIPSDVEFERYGDYLKFNWAMDNYTLVQRSHPESPDEWDPPTGDDLDYFDYFDYLIQWAKRIRNELEALKWNLYVREVFSSDSEDDMDIEELRHINLRF